MNQSIKKDAFLLVNVPLLRPAWPVPTFSRILPLLKSSGYQGDWWDENIKFFRYFYSEEKIIWAHHLILEKISRSTDAYHISLYERILQTPIEELIKALRNISNSETFSDLQTYKTSFQRVFIDCARLLSYAYDVIFDYNQLIYRSPINNKGFNFARVLDVIELVNGASQNISLEFFASSTMPRINEISPKIVGISISSAFELVPAFTLARLVKEHLGNKVHVVMGGNFLSRVEHRFRNSEPEKELYKTFWNWMDSYVYSKGDLALLKLVDCVLNGGDLKSVPNLVFKNRSDEIIENEFSYGLGIDDLPQSDFGSVLEQKHLYFVPPEYLTVPIYTSIGCSYAKCTFCAIDKMSGNFHAGLDVRKINGTKYLKGKNGETFRFYRKTDKILKEMIDIKEQHNISYFSFNDETIDIDFALQFSEEVIKGTHTIYWQAFARADNRLTSPPNLP